MLGILLGGVLYPVETFLRIHLSWLHDRVLAVDDYGLRIVPYVLWVTSNMLTKSAPSKQSVHETGTRHSLTDPAE